MDKISFCGGDLGKSKVLTGVLKRAVSQINIDDLLNYQDTQGLNSLRENISRVFGLEGKEILITNSATEALYLALKINGGGIALQNPAYFGVNRQAKDLWKDVCTWGKVDELQKAMNNQHLKIIYLTSNISGVTGQSHSLNEKNAINQLAINNRALIIEDNPYDLLYFGDEREKRLIDINPNVLYIGTFAKILGPGIALGFLAGNEDQIKKAKSVKITISLRTSASDMQVANYALSENYLSDLRNENYNKWLQFKKLLNKYGFDFLEVGGGIFVQVQMPQYLDIHELIGKAKTLGIEIEENKFYYFDGINRPFIRLNFVKNNIEENNEGLKVLSDLIFRLKSERVSEAKRRNESLNFDLPSKSDEGWLNKTDFKNYAIRQAQSCIFLDVTFAKLRQSIGIGFGKVNELFDYLLGCHDRQYLDIASVIEVPEDPNRRSFYFEENYRLHGLDINDLPKELSNNNLLKILAIQAVSYLRGYDRYSILKDCDLEGNEDFKAIWGKFYFDAPTNAQKVLDCMLSLFDKTLVKDVLKEALEKEDQVMKTIWRHNNVK